MSLKKKAAVKNLGGRNDEGKLLSVSGWCMTGQHKADEKSGGCRKNFTESVCVCDCHEEEVDALEET